MDIASPPPPSRIKRFVSATALLLSGAALGVAGAKYFAPQWLVGPAPAAAAPANVTTNNIAGGTVTFNPPIAVARLTVTPPAAPTSATPTTSAMSRPSVTVTTDAAPKPFPVPPPDEDARRRALHSLLLTCRSQLELYKLQHRDALPDFAKHRWNQLTAATRADGAPDPRGDCGPYLHAAPANPLNAFTSLGLVRKDPKPGQVMPGEKLGFVYCPTTGHLFGTAADGKTIFDETGVPDPILLPLTNSTPPSDIAPGSLGLQLQMLRSTLQLYKLQHAGAFPDFSRFPSWEQLTRPTRSNGSFDLRGFGPYLSRRPVNPVNGFARVEQAPAVPANYKAAGQQTGYVFETTTGQIFATDADGALWKP